MADSTYDHLPLRPGPFVEHKLITAVLDGTYPPGSSLPGERILAGRLGVTRPTLREGLHRLAGQGWFTISHGKPTMVNNFWKKGGMGLLATLSKYAEYLPKDFVIHILEARATLLPTIARLAAVNEPGALVQILDQAEAIEEDAGAFMRFDWNLQISMAGFSNNPVYLLILNDFSSMHEVMGVRYFKMQEARRTSRAFYLEMGEDLRAGGNRVEDIVRTAMERSVVLWRGRERGKAHG